MTIEELKELGADTQDGLKRCGNNEAFYLKLIPKALEESKYKELEEKINEKKFAEAFEVAHALKGVLSNLSLTPIYEPIYEITELLRNKSDVDYSALLGKMWEEKNRFPN